VALRPVSHPGMAQWARPAVAGVPSGLSLTTRINKQLTHVVSSFGKSAAAMIEDGLGCFGLLIQRLAFGYTGTLLKAKIVPGPPECVAAEANQQRPTRRI
jgi:hypothetical protein